MWQGRFWGKARRFDRPAKRKLNIQLSERGVYELVKLEKHVVSDIVGSLWLNGIPVNIQPERVPSCSNCGGFVCKPSKAGQPDLHGWIPARKLPPVDNRYCSLQAVAFYIECKRPKGGVETYVQRKFIADAQRDGVLAFFARSWEDVKNAFAKVGVTLHDGENVHKNNDGKSAQAR